MMSAIPISPRFFAIGLAVLLSGCAAVQVQVKPDRVDRPVGHTAPRATSPAAFAPASQPLSKAENGFTLSSTERLALVAQAVRALWPELRREQPDAEAIALYTRCALLAGRLLAREIPGGNLTSFCEKAGYRLDPSAPTVLDLSSCQEFLPATAIRARNLHQRSQQAGYGAAFAAYYPRNAPLFVNQPGIPRSGLALPATVLLIPQGQTMILSVRNVLRHDTASLAGHVRPLAADFSAALALTLSHGVNRSIDLGSMIFSRQRFGTSGLYQFEPYNPAKIPVVFVHGLMSRPEAWSQAVNHLLADPVIRKNYQFWLYLYPTGLPVWNSAANLRSELDRFQKELAVRGNGRRLKEMILIGHSMGGLISSLQIRQGGQLLWQQFSDVPLEKLPMGPEARQEFQRMVDFSPRPEIRRVIFVATPHRGSNLALRPISGFISSLIQLPFSALSPYRSTMLDTLRDDARSTFEAPATSIRFLRANSPLLHGILKLPVAPGVAFHSIIGDRGRNDTPKSSDGIVPYWSSHLEGAASEKIVPSGHGANEHPDGVEEIRRILLLNLKERNL